MSQLIDPTLILFLKYYYCFKRWSYSTPFPICRSTGDLSTRQYLPTYSKMTIGHSIILTNPIDLEIAFISCHICLVLISRHICLDVISHPINFDVLFPQSDNTFISKSRGKTWASPAAICLDMVCGIKYQSWKFSKKLWTTLARLFYLSDYTLFFL